VENVVTLIGNLGGDPSLVYTNSGAAVANFSIAINTSYTGKDGNKVDKPPYWFDVVAWRQLAENVAESLTQGDRVIVSGKLEVSKWETEDGQKRSAVKIVADSVGPDLRFATASVTKTRREGFAEEATG
jgi:single-strand DNA-binding protein